MIKSIFFILSYLLTWQGSAFENHDSLAALNLEIDLAHVDLQPFYKGYYGKIGSSTLFIATKKLVPDETRLYWAIVQVLSKKYGCFIQRKDHRGPYTSFLCRDKRIVVFHSRSSGQHVLFSGRQFDSSGQEIVVNNRNIVGRYPIFANSFPTQKNLSLDKAGPKVYKD